MNKVMQLPLEMYIQEDGNTVLWTSLYNDSFAVDWSRHHDCSTLTLKGLKVPRPQEHQIPLPIYRDYHETNLLDI